MKHIIPTSLMALSLFTGVSLANAADHGTATSECEAAIASELSLTDDANITREGIKTRGRHIKLRFKAKDEGETYDARCLTTSGGEVIKVEIESSD